MGEQTAIGWTDHTFNPWWGCERVSPGCQHCYAEAFAKRTGHAVWGKQSDRRFFGDKHWAEPLKWNRQAEAEGRRHRVFCASMADVFEDRPELDEHRSRLWALIESTWWLDWQLLTKRPRNALRMVPPWINEWPANLWIGTTVEDQQRADERIPHLLQIPAPIRFLSCEPLLGPVVLPAHALIPLPPPMGCGTRANTQPAPPGIDWVIIGGESGPGHRPLNLDHARRIIHHCEIAGVPVFFKQVGGRTPTAGGDEIDGRRWKQFPEVADA